MWVIFLYFSWFLNFSILNISIVKLVVIDVIELSVLLTVAAINPRTKLYFIAQPNEWLIAISAKSISPLETRELFSEKVAKKTPKTINKKITTSKKKENTKIFFFDSFKFLQLKFFCIKSWSSPVMQKAINIPPINCFKK